MASSDKTEHLMLNVWSGSDKPTRSDFVRDNELIDTAYWLHKIDMSMHLNQEQKERVSNPYVVSVVAGNGESERAVTLGFLPKMVFYFAQDKPLFSVDNGVQVVNCCAAVSGFGSTASCELGTNGFFLTHGEVGGVRYDLNKQGVQYVLVAFR